MHAYPEVALLAQSVAYLLQQIALYLRDIDELESLSV